MKARHLLLLLVLICPPPVDSANRNKLAGHPSPCLAMHAGDPVNWQPWGPQPLEQARREDKLIMLSSGYFSCHWCHVMRRESYRDPKIARLLNEVYIPVKVDRELEPVLDEQLEKMLSDNAQLVELYLNAAEVFSEPEFEQIAYDTLDFMLSDMIGPVGAFVAALSAIDEEGKEGGYYLWTSDELKDVLSDQEYKLAALAWGFGGNPDTQRGSLPIETLSPAQIAPRTRLAQAEVVKRLVAVRQKLLLTRRSRRLPKDTKRLIAWNGLALSALSQAATRTPQRYGMAAFKLRNFIVSIGWSEERLSRAIDDDGQSLGPGTLTDYAYVAKGLLEWAKFTAKQKDYELSARLAAAGWQRFYTPQGWRMDETSLIPTQPPRYHISDGAQPSASAVLLGVSLELLHQPRLAIHRVRIQNYLELMSQDLVTRPLAHATHVAVLFNKSVRIEPNF
jgi:uncharacterized protein YyaL (SSP411 family)